MAATDDTKQQILRFRTEGLERAAREYAGRAGIEFEKAWSMATRGVIRNVIAITPPGQGERAKRSTGESLSAMLTGADKQRGISAVRRDLGLMFIGKPYQGKRSEQHPDPEADHRILVKLAPKGLRAGTQTSVGVVPLTVDIRKLQSLGMKLEGRVGTLASGWQPGAQSMGVTTPAWIKKSGQGSTTGPLNQAGKFFFQMAANRVPDKLAGEMGRRIPYAMAYAQGDLERNTAGVARKAALKAGFNYAA